MPASRKYPEIVGVVDLGTGIERNRCDVQRVVRTRPGGHCGRGEPGAQTGE